MKAKEQWKSIFASGDSSAKFLAKDDWVIGSEQSLTNTDEAKVISSSSNYSSDISRALLKESDVSFSFADHDTRQDIYIDLGVVASISHIRANFPTSDRTVCGPIVIRVSANNEEYYDWNTFSPTLSSSKYTIYYC
jgi:hypothetical protein